MCGIAGILRNRPGPELASLARAMADTLSHRGPDDAGCWSDEEAGVGLGHRRLSIIDLSPHGHQPMMSASGRYVIAFNGEIYNHRELRGALAAGGVSFRGHSDTEVLLEMIASVGLEAALQRSVGMFALAVWDRAEQTLHLARDRLGQKPLYYGWAGGDLVFGSELRSLRAHPDFSAEVDRGVLALFLRYSYVPAPHSIFSGVYKLMPGTVLTLDARTAAPGASGIDPWASPRPYWSLADVARRGQGDPFPGDADRATDALEQVLGESVEARMVADVPLGAFLSGGIDSTTVVALMQARSAAPVHTFTLGFEHREEDEADAARAVARHLGTEHTELRIGREEVLATVPEMPRVFDEPFADSSQIPTYLLARLARRSVTVALSGDGGDELFLGYRRYLRGLRIWRALQRIPRPLRLGLAGVLAAGTRGRHPEDRWRNLSGELRSTSVDAMYRQRLSRWQHPRNAVIGAVEPRCLFTGPAPAPDIEGAAERMMLLDLLAWLPDDILAKVDRASMAVSLEARNPLLDHRVVELAWRLPLSLKLREGQTKYLLRRVLHRHVPPQLVDRPKTGFGAPIRAWLRGPLREWAEAQLSRTRLEQEGYFDAGIIRGMWTDTLAGRGRWHNHLWPVLMFQAWLEAGGTTGTRPARD
ncbi:MAG TPA: asparagine synthase (glutamine-hydrolyzing) [Gammaproteobacteria bacterium]|nr:asparagine synthase (glutamine-hydrolyzing) [Gammaproteobacteria bacterium]